MQDLDIRLLREAYYEALKATGNSDPNPAVGAIVADGSGNILSRGSTQRAGFAHAERMALQAADVHFAGLTLYVTLEPCCHHGRTPPCTDIIREKKIARVVIGERDFAAEVMGKSVDLLRQSGVAVEVLPEQLFEKEKLLTTASFFFARRLKRPRLMLKWAQTADGAIAPVSGPSGKISGDTAAAVTAALRNYCKFTLASPGTVRSDRPRLDVRLPASPVDLQDTGFSEVFKRLIEAQLNQPGNTELPNAYKAPARGYLTYPLPDVVPTDLLKFQKQIAPDFLLLERSPQDLRQAFLPTMHSVLAEILAHGFNSVLIEAGPGFSQSLLDAGLADLVVVYKSKELTAQKLWDDTGRGNSASSAIAAAEGGNPTLAGFQLLERADLGSDWCFIFQRNADD
ncbi:MAG: bifunctional diaminohydroxyphosphoribosylaminopyrimidine deaminase/5-amino-6-(5-phosphoribosylamino)uracil reductase RibD [Turneriella sp.]